MLANELCVLEIKCFLFAEGSCTRVVSKKWNGFCLKLEFQPTQDSGDERSTGTSRFPLHEKGAATSLEL